MVGISLGCLINSNVENTTIDNLISCVPLHTKTENMAQLNKGFKTNQLKATRERSLLSLCFSIPGFDPGWTLYLVSTGALADTSRLR